MHVLGFKSGCLEGVTVVTESLGFRGMEESIPFVGRLCQGFAHRVVSYVRPCLRGPGSFTSGYQKNEFGSKLKTEHGLTDNRKRNEGESTAEIEV